MVFILFSMYSISGSPRQVIYQEIDKFRLGLGFWRAGRPPVVCESTVFLVVRGGHPSQLLELSIVHIQRGS